MIDNVRESIRMINALGGIADGAVFWHRRTPKSEAPVKARLFASSSARSAQVAEKIFTDEYFVEKAVEMERPRRQNHNPSKIAVGQALTPSRAA